MAVQLIIVLHWQGEVRYSARLSESQSWGDVGWNPLWADLKASGGLAFPTWMDGSLDGWIGGHSGKRRQFHFPSAALVQHQQAFHSLTYFSLQLFFLHWVSHISACFNHSKQRLARFLRPGRQVLFSPHAASPTSTFLLIWKAEWWVSMSSLRCWTERSGLSRCQPAAGASMLGENLAGVGKKDRLH